MGYNVAMVGATGAVGETINQILSERDFPVAEYFPLASARSAGKTTLLGDREFIVGDLDKFDFSKVDIAFFSAGAEVSKTYAPRAVQNSCVVIDNTSQYRMDDDIPLIIPEVNPEAVEDYKKRGIVANPNCSTIQMLLALKPLNDFSRINRVVVATYQAVSGTGSEAIEELRQQSKQVLNGQETKPHIYPKQIAFNALPHIDEFLSNGFTKEEIKMHEETIKILGEDNIMVSATAVRIPVFYGHSEAVLIETQRPISPDKARQLLASAPGVTVVDDPKNSQYPTAVDDAAGNDTISVGRIRTDISNTNGLWLWIVGDNLRKGAALNSIQIAELLIKNGLQPK